MSDTFEISIHTEICLHRDDIPKDVWAAIVSDIEFYIGHDGNIIMYNFVGINDLEVRLDLEKIIQEEIDDSDYADPEWRERVHKKFKELRDKLNTILGE